MAAPVNNPQAQLPIQLTPATPAVNVNINAATGILTVGQKQYNISIGNTGYTSLDLTTQNKIDDLVRNLLNNVELKETLAGTRINPATNTAISADTIQAIKISQSAQNTIQAEITRSNAAQNATPQRISVVNQQLYSVCTEVHQYFQAWQRQQQQQQAAAQQAAAQPAAAAPQPAVAALPQQQAQPTPLPVLPQPPGAPPRLAPPQQQPASQPAAAALPQQQAQPIPLPALPQFQDLSQVHSPAAPPPAPSSQLARPQQRPTQQNRRDPLVEG